MAGYAIAVWANDCTADYCGEGDAARGFVLGHVLSVAEGFIDAKSVPAEKWTTVELESSAEPSIPGPIRASTEREATRRGWR